MLWTFFCIYRRPTTACLAWKVRNIAVDVLLGMSFIDRSIYSIFQTERKFFPWHLRPVTIIKTKPAKNSVYANSNSLDCNNNSQDFIICASMQQTIFLPHCTSNYDYSSYANDCIDPASRHCDTVLMTNETHHNIVEYSHSMTARLLSKFHLESHFSLHI